MSDELCAARSIAIGEALAGTAIANISHFLVLEHAGAWGPKGLEDSALPLPIVEHLRSLSKRYPRLRVQLIRSRGGALGSTRRMFLAQCDEQRGTLAALTLDSDEALLALDLEPWLRGEAPAPGLPETEPLFLVCVHGKRDRCCALLGMPLYRALSGLASERVYQTTHLGGHRFAATLVVLPQGVCYGRVDPGEAHALLEASRAHRLHDPARMRGRTLYGSEAQAAEIALRTRLSERGEDALRLIDVAPFDEGTTRVRFAVRDDDRVHEVELTREALPPAPASCGAAPKSAEKLVAIRLSSTG